MADGGKHYWIEPESLVLGAPLTLTGNDSLNGVYGQDKYGGSKYFQILRDDEILNSVLVSVGRFGIVYSIVLAAVRQYWNDG